MRSIKSFSKRFVGKNSKKRGTFSKTFSMIPYAEDDEKLIEIFDVVIKTKNRLVVRDGKSQEDIHCSQEYIDLAESYLNSSNYMHRMSKAQQDNQDEEEEDNRPVYDLSSVQTRMYDPNDEEFVQ